MASQNRFYLLVAALTFSNSAMGISINNGELCPTDTSRTCYTCNGYTEGTTQWSHREEEIAGACSDHDDGYTWCTSYQRYSNGDIMSNGNNSGYECTTSGWQYRAVLEACSASNCKSSSWASHRTGYENRTYRYCASSSNCVAETQYRCAQNYYGSTTNGTSGCTKCSDSIDYTAYIADNGKYVSSGKTQPGYTAGAGTTSRTACYIPALGGSMSYMDSTGVYEYNGNCYWS